MLYKVCKRRSSQTCGSGVRAGCRKPICTSLSHKPLQCVLQCRGAIWLARRLSPTSARMSDLQPLWTRNAQTAKKLKTVRGSKIAAEMKNELCYPKSKCVCRLRMVSIERASVLASLDYRIKKSEVSTGGLILPSPNKFVVDVSTFSTLPLKTVVCDRFFSLFLPRRRKLFFFILGFFVYAEGCPSRVTFLG